MAASRWAALRCLTNEGLGMLKKMAGELRQKNESKGLITSSYSLAIILLPSPRVSMIWLTTHSREGR
jgi:hypothetical protein